MAGDGKYTEVALAARYVLSILRLDEASTGRILREMSTDEIRVLAQDALLLHDRAHDCLRERAAQARGEAA